MGQKTHPIGFRIGYNKTWGSRWFDAKDYGNKVNEDLSLRKYIQKRLRNAAVSKIDIERAAGKIRVYIHTARPGTVIGRKGAEIEKLRKELTKRVKSELKLNIVEVRKPETDAQLLAEGVALQLERRIAFRRAMRKTEETAMRAGAKGVKIMVSGRLNGAEIARSEEYKSGSVPLQTLKADIDYGFSEAMTTYGIIGVKVWVNKGEALPVKETRG